ncbi:MAG: carboxypeptidase [Gemmatimonadales bacterium]|nr:MAG: carboxypeptidase [Gemmatimonadales bacterium]
MSLRDLRQRRARRRRSAEGAERARRRRWPWILAGVLGFLSVGIVGFAVWEMRTSHFQARFLTPLAAEATWWVEEGVSPRPARAPTGPYDLRLGYASLPERVKRASDRGFEVREQGRVSDRFVELVDERGLFPVYRQKTRAGLQIVDREGDVLFDHHRPEWFYPSFEAIPPVVWQSLLFIENRSMLDPEQPLRNPAVEWGRLLRSVSELGLRYVGREGRVAGASTLATQMEKFRHAPEGITETPADKLRQMASAALRGYLDGEETLPARRGIVLDYLNSVPLAAIRGEGEILGLAEGLRSWYGADVVRLNWLLSRVAVDQSGLIPRPEQILPPGTRSASSFWEEVRTGTSPRLPGEDVGSDPPHGLRRVEAGPWEPTTPPLGPATDPLRPAPLEADEWREAGEGYRQVLALLLAQRRPSYHLTRPEGREALDRLVDRHLNLLEAQGLIPSRLAREARAARPELRVLAPPRPPVPFVERKAANAVRTQLLGLLGIERLYELDRTDLTVRTTIDSEAQEVVTRFLTRLQDPAFVRERGLDEFRLLDRGDPASVVYSVLLNERTSRGNVVRIQVDNLDAPFNLNESARLELGSTAKLRTLVSYLEIIAELHGRLAPLGASELRAYPIAAQDRLSLWVRDQLLARPDLDLDGLLQRAMVRSYSANPAQRFQTGGGVQTFSNFDRTYDQQVVTVSLAFQQSINLVFVRMMRDIVDHYMYRVPGSTAHVLEERDTPLRQEYLARFADREGIEFLNRFIPRYEDAEPEQILHRLLEERRLAPQRIAWAVRAVAPDLDVSRFENYLRIHHPDAEFSAATVEDLFRRADPDPHSLADLGYLSSVHPLELWVARYLRENPGAPRSELLDRSRDARQDVYRWLFRTRHTNAQDRRILSLLEVEAFTQVLEGWQRLGYPFRNIVPSLGTSIGSSGDRPAALSDLLGIILNDGMLLPTHRVDELHFAANTPFETRLERVAVEGERVMEPEVARVLKQALTEVVDLGTGRRARNTVRDPDGIVVPVGAKTGTGDNRYRIFAPGGRLVESRSVNRTSSLVFFVGDRFYGVITAYVAGEEADDFRFTSALPAQIFRELAPVFEGLLHQTTPALDG